MSDVTDENHEGSDQQVPGQERPLRWAPDESSEQQRLSALGAGAERPPDLPGEPTPPPPLPTWERLEEEGAWQALLSSIKEILIEPAETFARMPRKPELGRPLLFNVLLETLAVVIATCYRLIYQAIVPPTGRTYYEQFLDQLGIAATPLGPNEMLILSVGSVVLAPFFIVILAFVWAGIVHLFLLLFGGARHGYETTFRTLCYVSGATSVFALIPVCGLGIIAPIWSVVCSIIGLTRSQQTSGGKAAAAVLVPLLFCCCCITTGIMLFRVLLLAAIASGG